MVPRQAKFRLHDREAVFPSEANDRVGEDRPSVA
jgi:hypothetical protein